MFQKRKKKKERGNHERKRTPVTIDIGAIGLCTISAQSSLFIYISNNTPRRL